MAELTVAVVSAFIAAGIAIAQFVLPNILALILTGLLSEEQPAVTWSVVSRFFLSSDWPTLLRSEAATTHGVPRKISLVTWTKPLGLLLIAIAAIVTPLGLYEVIVPVSYPGDVHFVYAADSSLFGLQTPARSDRGYHFSRLCGQYLCPGDPDIGNITISEVANGTTNQTELNSYYIKPEAIAATLTDLYESGLTGSSPSLSSYFDVQARQWTTKQFDIVENNGSLLEADYKYIYSIFMDGKVKLVEGLIIDAENGGIGFRNHSVPVVHSLYGVEWEEDILWMQPESACVNTNLSVMFTGELTHETRTGELVDRGGFCNLEKVNPYYSPSNETQNYIFEDAQKDAWLYERAYYLAWYNNALIMEYLNITDPLTNRSRVSSSMGQKFQVNGTMTAVSSASYNDDFFKLWRANSFVSMPKQYNWNSSVGWYNYDDNPAIPNPHNVTGDNIEALRQYCIGALGGDHVNISLLDVSIGFVAGPAVMLNQSNPSNASSAATWERPVYTCSGATAISVKTVRMRYNSTKEPALINLEILNIVDKKYSSETALPTWGFETPMWDASTTWNLSHIDPLWGIVGSVNPFDKDITTLRFEKFYLPASYQTTSYFGWDSTLASYRDYTPGTSGPSIAWRQVLPFSVDRTTDPYSSDDLEKQRFLTSMSANSTSTSRLMRLLWTDIASNLLVGTRGLHQARYQPLQSQNIGRRDQVADLSTLPDGQYPVYLLDRRIRYHWVYSIPAFICITMIMAVLLVALVAVLGGRASVARLKWYMFNTASGRVLASFAYPDLGRDKSADTKEWLEIVGGRPVMVSDNTTVVEMQPIRMTGKESQTYVRIGQEG